MADFQVLRTFLEEHQAQFASQVGNPPEFEREFANLQKSWQSTNDQGALREVTEKAMRKYGPVWQALVSAGLVHEDQPRETIEADTAVPSSVVSKGAPSEEKDIEQLQPESGNVPLAKPFPLSESEHGSNQPQQTETKSRGERTMEGQQLSQSTEDRIALWRQKIVIGKEIMAGLMGVAIVVVTLVVALSTIFSVNNVETHAAAKDALLFLNGLVGVVLGYYFGRVPSEARAEKSEEETRKTRSDLDQTTSEGRGIIEESITSPDGSRGGGEITLTPVQVEHLRHLLRQR